MCVGKLGITPLRTTRSQLKCVVRHIQYNNFIKFNVHNSSQGCLPTPIWMYVSGSRKTVVIASRTIRKRKKNAYIPLSTSRSLLQRVIRDILCNDFFKFNVHSRLQG